MMKQLVPQELRPLSWPKFTSLLYKYLKNPQVGKLLGIHVDMDYLESLEYEEREYIVDFLFVWYREYLDSHDKRRDVYAQYERGNVDITNGKVGPEKSIDKAELDTDSKVIKMWDRKLINSYTVRDYMPSKLFNEDQIIQYIDYEKSKKKGLLK